MSLADIAIAELAQAHAAKITDYTLIGDDLQLRLAPPTARTLANSFQEEHVRTASRPKNKTNMWRAEKHVAR